MYLLFRRAVVRFDHRADFRGDPLGRCAILDEHGFRCALILWLDRLIMTFLYYSNDEVARTAFEFRVRLIRSSIDWLIDWLMDSLIDRLIVHLIGWSYILCHFLIDWLINDCIVVWVILYLSVSLQLWYWICWLSLSSKLSFAVHVQLTHPKWIILLVRTVFRFLRSRQSR